MNVEEILRERGDQWQAPAVRDPDLDAALGRSARRNRATRLAAAVLAVVAVGSTAWAVLPVGRDVPATPAPAVTPPDPTQSTSGATIAARGPVTNDALAEVARSLRGDFRYPSNNDAKTVDVVRSTVGSVAGASILPAPQGTDTSAAVWVLQLEADFRCDTCSHPKGKVARQPVLRALVREDLEVIATGTFDKPAELGHLGNVSTLSLATEPPGFDEAKLRESIRRSLAGVDSVDLTQDLALQTTSWRAQSLFGVEQDPRSFRSVWVVTLDGRFTCSTCTRLQDSATGKSLAIVIDASTYQLEQLVISTRTIDARAVPGRGLIRWSPSVLR